jgi:hypothetical protein
MRVWRQSFRSAVGSHEPWEEESVLAVLLNCQGRRHFEASSVREG